jgi:hypothetical protein
LPFWFFCDYRQQDRSPEKADYIVKERKRDVLKRKMSRLVGLHDRQGQF